MTIRPTGRRPAGRALRCSIAAHDHWPWCTWIAALGLLAAAALAVAGLPPVDIHGPLHFVGIMDPLCGGTRAVRLAMLGRWTQSFRYNPIGVPLIIGASIMVLRAGIRWVSGRWVGIDIAWTRRRRVLVGMLALIAAAAIEVHQQTHAELLMARH